MCVCVWERDTQTIFDPSNYHSDTLLCHVRRRVSSTEDSSRASVRFVRECGHSTRPYSDQCTASFFYPPYRPVPRINRAYSFSPNDCSFPPSNRISLLDYTVKCREPHGDMYLAIERAVVLSEHWKVNPFFRAVWKGNRGGRWTSGRPPQNRAIVLQGSREPLLVYRAGSQGSVTRFWSRLAVVFFRHVRSSYKGFRRALFLSISLAPRSLSLSLCLSVSRFATWKNRRARSRPANRSIGEESECGKKQSASTVGWESKEREKRKEKRNVSRDHCSSVDQRLLTALRDRSASFVTDRIPWLRTVLSRATSDLIVARSARQGAAGVYERVDGVSCFSRWLLRYRSLEREPRHRYKPHSVNILRCMRYKRYSACVRGWVNKSSRRAIFGDRPSGARVTSNENRAGSRRR